MEVLEKNYFIKEIIDREITFDEEENKTINDIVRTYADGMKDSHKHWEDKRKAAAAWLDDAVGKKGEFIARFGLSLYHDYPLIDVDTKIYAKKDKSFKPDLPYPLQYGNMFNVHVKTCSNKTIAAVIRESWTFQKSDSTGFGRDPILEFGKYTDLVAFVFVPTWESATGVIRAIVPLQMLHDLKFFKDPEMIKYRDTKACVYLDIFQKYPEMIKRWTLK